VNLLDTPIRGDVSFLSVVTPLREWCGAVGKTLVIHQLISRVGAPGTSRGRLRGAAAGVQHERHEIWTPPHRKRLGEWFPAQGRAGNTLGKSEATK